MKKFRYLIIIALFLLDQWVKVLVRQNMYVGESIDVLGEFFQITYVQNRGAAFSILMGQQIFLTVVPLIALVIAIWYMERNLDKHWTLMFSLQLIIFGGFGNLYDRLTRGYVTDMFDFNVWNAVFNVADIGVCVGCGLLILYMFVFDKPKAEPAEAELASEVGTEE